MANLFQDLVYTENDVLSFPAGIPGFERNTRFILLQVPDYAPFEWLVCIDGSQLRFAIVNPLLFNPDYSPNIAKEQLDSLGIEKPEDVLLYAIVTIKENPVESTANLIGPVVINRTKRIGKQIIIDDERYSTREKILREI